MNAIQSFWSRGFKVYLGSDGYMIESPHGHRRDLYKGKNFRNAELETMFQALVSDPKQFVKDCSQSPKIDRTMWAEFISTR